MTRILFFLTFYTLSGMAFAQHTCYIDDEAKTPRERLVDFTHLDAALSFEPEKGKISGEVTHYYTVIREKIDSFILDAPGITIHRAILDGYNVPFKTVEGKLIFNLPNAQKFGTEHELLLTYEAFPKKGMYFIGWEDTSSSVRKQIWTQGQGIDNRHWIPVFDDMSEKFTTTFEIEFAEKYRVISNGKLKSSKTRDGKTTWTYEMEKPHAPYLMMIAIGEYAVKELKSESGVPLNLFYYPDWENRVSATYKGSKEVFDFFEKRIGIPYPWQTYSQVPVQDFLYGAMENTSATIFGDFFFVDNRGFKDANYVYVNAHELAHQWFGDLITSRSPHAHWLHESFATYFHLLWEKQFFGNEHFKQRMYQNEQAILAEGAKNNYPIVHSKAGSIRHYQKGAWVLNMLKDKVGEETFYRVIKEYTLANQYQNVDTEDLLTAFHTHAGLALDGFWEQWILHGGEPNFEISYYETEKAGRNQIVLSVNQTHETNKEVGLFEVNIDIEVYYADGSISTKQLNITDAQNVFYFDTKEGNAVEFLVFDANNKILANESYERTYQELSAQARKARHAIDRYKALVALRAFPMHQKRDLLNTVGQSEKNTATKGEAIKQLIAAGDVYGQALVRKFAAGSNSDLKKDILEATSLILAEVQSDYEIMLFDSSYEVVEAALRLLVRNFPSKAEQYLKDTRNVYGVRGLNVRISWLALQVERTKDPQYFNELVDYTAYGVEFLTRMNAANTLKSFNYIDDEFIQNLMDGATNSNSKLRRSFRAILSYYNQQYQNQESIARVLANWPNAEEKVELNRILR